MPHRHRFSLAYPAAHFCGRFHFNFYFALPTSIRHNSPSPLPPSRVCHNLTRSALPMPAALGNFLQAHYTIYSYFSFPISHLPFHHSHFTFAVAVAVAFAFESESRAMQIAVRQWETHRNKQSDKGNMLANILHGVEDWEHWGCPQ